MNQLLASSGLLLFARFRSWRPLLNLDPTAFLADPELLRGLEEQATPISCSEDRVLFRQGESPSGLCILKSGEATLTMTSTEGKEIATARACAGSLLGLPGLIGNQPYTLTAVAHAGAQVVYVTRDSFTALMRSDGLLAMKILQVLAAEVRSARSAILEQRSPHPRRGRGLTPSRQA